MHTELTDSNYKLALLCSTCFIQIALEGIETSLDMYTSGKKKKRKKDLIINYKEVVTEALFHMFGC